MHALIENGSIIRVGARPDWRDGDTGAPLTDEQWLSHGWLPVIDEETDHDPTTHYIVERPWADWTIALPGWVFRTFDVVALPPAPPPPPPPPIEITADVLFFDRMTNEEYDDLDASVKAGETARVYRGWAAATTFTEGSAMWTLLDKHLSLVVTAERKAELLARPIQLAALAGNEALAA